MSNEHINSNNYLKGRFINIGNIITDTTNNWQFGVEMEQTNDDSCLADTISVLTFLNRFAEELNELHGENQKLQNELETYKSGNVVLKKTLDKYEKLMRKHNIGSIEKLDKLLTWERRL